MQPLFLCRFGSETGAKKGFRAQMLDTLLDTAIASLNYLQNTQVDENQDYSKNRQSLQKRSIPVDASVYPQPHLKTSGSRTFCCTLLLGQRGRNADNGLP